MDIRTPNTSTAAYILKKRMQERGVSMLHTDALEIVATMKGFQSYQALAVFEADVAARPKPVLKQVDVTDTGTDFQYVGPKDGNVYIRVGCLDVHLQGHRDGVTVTSAPNGLPFDTLMVFELEHEEAAEALARAALSNPASDFGARITKISEEAGYKVSKHLSHAGMFVVSGPEGLVGSSYRTPEAAWLEAFADAYDVDLFGIREDLRKAKPVDKEAPVVKAATEATASQHLRAGTIIESVFGESEEATHGERTTGHKAFGTIEASFADGPERYLVAFPKDITVTLTREQLASDLYYICDKAPARMHVVAWRSPSSAGFVPFASLEAANKGFEEEKANCDELKDEGRECFRFDVHVRTLETATQEIDFVLDELLAESGIRYRAL